MIVTAPRGATIQSAPALLSLAAAFPPAVCGSQEYNRHTRRRKMLLELQISIACDENVEPLQPIRCTDVQT